ncbi:putative cullin protein, neddylation [Medicago truncatula]|nr:putative cullin protein, neddylation [Medicago truncatula]
MIFVQELLDMKDKYDSILNLAFNHDEEFHGVLDSSFEYIINLNHNLPEFLSSFLDVKLRKGFEGNSEEIILDKVMMFIKLLHDKDLFHKYYKKHLPKRLLFGKTISEDIERSLAVKLKRVCGYKFALLEIMVMDIKTSKEMLQGFYRSHAKLGDDPKLIFQVLTTGSWPLLRTTDSSCNLPVEVSALHEKYKSYYLGINAGKKLSLQPNMGNAEIIATFGNGRKHELHVSTYQMCVLMLFNDIDQLSYKDIETATKINSLDLIKCLYSMVFVNGKNIIKKVPMNGNISEGDVFFINDMFKSKFYKIKLETVATQRESEHEKLQTRKNVEEDRRPKIEAAIVRIMKFKKQLDHKNIIAEVTKELKSLFLLNPTEIKKRIESLIERDYLERDNIHNNLNRYLA